MVSPNYYIFLDSQFRSNLSELATDFNVSSQQTKDWPSVKQYLNNTVAIDELFIYYDTVLAEPFVKLNFHNREFNDPNLVNTLDGNQIHFILKIDKIYPGNWYNYKTTMMQTMRLPKKGSYKFTLFDKNNNILNCGTNGRVVCNIRINDLH
jgi:hypothetical protein